jgi:tRNA A37 N6-isopentenylltransferase MiaA
MSADKVDIIIIRGAPASGKSQTAKKLAEYFPKGVRMEVDNLRSMVISVDWTNQAEHINILTLSTKLVNDFISLGFKPIIVVDTFSGTKLIKYLDDLLKINKTLNIKVFGLFTSDSELYKRLEIRKNGEFNDLAICQKLNNEVINEKYNNEFQIDTSDLQAIDTSNVIYTQLIND